MKTRFILFAAIVLSVISCGSPKGNNHQNDNQGLGKSSAVVRLVQYNVGAFAKYMDNSTQMIADMLNEMKADVCSINETDSCNTRHNVYQMEELNKALGSGWNFTFGRAMPYREGAYGNGVLTKEKIINTFNIALPKGTGSEPRAAVGVETDKYVYVSTHIDYSTSDAAHGQVSLLAAKLKEMYGNSDKPVFVGGDFNMVPSDPVLKDFENDFKRISIDKPTAGSKSPTKCIDYVYALKNGACYEVKKSDVPTGFMKGDVKLASDHLPIYVDVIIK